MKFQSAAWLAAARRQCLGVKLELANKLESTAPVGTTFVTAEFYSRHRVPEGPATVLILAGLFASGVFYALRRRGFTGLLEALFQGTFVGGAAAALIALLIPKTPIQGIIGGLWVLGIWAFVLPAAFLCSMAKAEDPSAGRI